MEVLKEVKEEYVDNFVLSKEDIEPYDVESTFVNVLSKLKELRIARNKYLNGYHARLTATYEPRLEMFNKGKISDPTGKEVEYNFDSELEYNRFNIQLNNLYNIMSKEENAYINDCLICGRSETSVRDKFSLSKSTFMIIKESAIVRFGIVFNIIVMK